MKLFFLVLLYLLCFYEIPAQTFDFRNDFTTFLNQTYTCGDEISSIKLQYIILDGENIEICFWKNSEHQCFTQKEIKELEAEFFGSGRIILLQNGCRFAFDVTGKTPKAIKDYFSDLYWNN